MNVEILFGSIGQKNAIEINPILCNGSNTVQLFFIFYLCKCDDETGSGGQNAAVVASHNTCLCGFPTWIEFWSCQEDKQVLSSEQRLAKMSTAAEKAEARRLKILAKKNARMAYAAGDHSKLPSTAPSEPVALQPTIAINPESSDATSEDQALLNTSARSTARSSGLAAPTAVLPPNARNAYPVISNRSSAKRSPLIGSRWTRTLFVASSAVLFAAVMYAGVVPLWKLSAMHVFASVEMCIFAPQLLGRVTEQGSDMGGLMPGPLGALVSATQYASVANQVVQDFSVFMLAFLCTWYVCAYL